MCNNDVANYVNSFFHNIPNTLKTLNLCYFTVLVKGTFANLLVKVKSINFKGLSLGYLYAYYLIPYHSHTGQTGWTN